MQRKLQATTLATAIALALSTQARADAVTDWNDRATAALAKAKLGTPPAVRVVALVQTAVNDAVKVTGNGDAGDAAVATATRAVLVKAVPATQGTIDAAYQAALAKIADSPAKAAGIDAGEKAAAGVFSRRSIDAIAPDDYRPFTAAGTYVPTASAAAPMWGRRAPWNLANAAAVRPAAPPALSSAEWVRDFNETRELGSRNSTRRSPEQTDIAKFWEYSLPPIYYGIVKSVAQAPGRDVLRNARLYAAVAQAMDDALIGVFDAKYTYNFWRPVTATRNADIDGNEATAREAGWSSLIEAPIHPEYPSGHAILASSVATVVKTDVGTAPMPVLRTSSPTLKGATRQWADVDAFVSEVSASRIYAGIHYRSATDAGEAMGKRIGELAAAKVLAP